MREGGEGGEGREGREGQGQLERGSPAATSEREDDALRSKKVPGTTMTFSLSASSKKTKPLSSGSGSSDRSSQT